MANAQPKQKGDGAKAINDSIIQLEKRFAAKEEADKVINTEIIARLNDILATIQNIKSNTRATTSKTTTTTTSERKFPSNSMYWLKEMWKTNPEEVISRFFNASVKDSINAHMQSTEELRNKKDDAKIFEEFRYLWHNHATSGKAVKDNIKKAYEVALAENQKMQPALAKADEEQNGQAN